MKKFYVLAWFLLAAAVLVSIFTGTFNPLAMVVFSLVAVGLVLRLRIVVGHRQHAGHAARVIYPRNDELNF